MSIICKNFNPKLGKLLITPKGIFLRSKSKIFSCELVQAVPTPTVIRAVTAEAVDSEKFISTENFTIKRREDPHPIAVAVIIYGALMATTGCNKYPQRRPQISHYNTANMHM